jgi:hypothetical protein
MWPFTRRQPAPRRGAGAAPEDVLQRLDRLEAMVEGLQDALYRDAQRHDQRIEDLHQRTQPGHMAKALSDDARKRGL